MKSTKLTAISCHLFLYHDLLEDNVFGAIAEAGFSAVELWAMQPHLPYRDELLLDRIESVMRKYEISAVTAHLPMYEKVHKHDAPRLALSMSDPDETLRAKWLEETLLASKAAIRLGAKVLTMHTDLIFSNLDKARFEAAKKSIGQLIEVDLPDGARFALENTPGGPRQVAGLIEMIEPYPADKIGVTLDVGHAHIDTDLIEAVGIMAPRLASVHAHDNDGTQDAHLIPGKGTVPWEKLGEKLGRIGFSGPIIWEIRDTSKGKDPDLKIKTKQLKEIEHFDERFSQP